eukprot:12888046-Prorocentrum_lima.AAC.1
MDAYQCPSVISYICNQPSTLAHSCYHTHGHKRVLHVVYSQTAIQHPRMLIIGGVLPDHICSS